MSASRVQQPTNSHTTHVSIDNPLKHTDTNTMVEDYTDIKVEQENECPVGLETQAVNAAFTSDTVPESNNINNFSFIRNLPQLTASQIEKDFNTHTLNCRKRYEQLLVSSGDGRGKQLNRLMVSGRSYGRRHCQRGRVLEVRAEFSQSGLGKDKCGVSKVEVFEMKPRNSDADQIWRI